MKKFLIVSASLVIALIIGALVALYPSSMRDVEPQGINLANIDDGRFIGTFERGRFTNTLAVYVESNRIVRIEIIEDIFMPSVTDASDEVFRRVIEMQDTKIDAVTGATVTANAYLKSIENALMQQ